jgi:hypothetical protein
LLPPKPVVLWKTALSKNVNSGACLRFLSINVLSTSLTVTDRIVNLESGDAYDVETMSPLLITNVALTAASVNPNEHTSLVVSYCPAGSRIEREATVATLFKHRVRSIFFYVCPSTHTFVIAD